MRQKDISKRKTILKIVSAFAAVIVWLFVSFAENPQIDVTVNTIPIQLSGEQNLNSRGFMILNKSLLPDASVEIRGKRQDLMSVMGNITASIDLSSISSTGVYDIKLAYDIPSSAVYISKRNTNSIEFEIAEIKEKTLDISIEQKDADRNKEYIIESVPEKKTITVKGAAEDIDKITKAAVIIDVGSMNENNEQVYDVTFENADGTKHIPVHGLFLEEISVKVTNRIYEKTTLNVSVQLPVTENDDYSVRLVNQSFTTVTAGIKNDSGRTVSELTNSSATDVISAEPGRIKHTVMLDLPEGIYLHEWQRYVDLELEIYENAEKVVSVPVNITNPDNLKYSLSSPTVDVKVSGPEEKLIPESVLAEINLNSISNSPGIWETSVEIISNDSDVTIITKKANISVSIE